MNHSDNSKNELTMAKFYGNSETAEEKALDHLMAMKVILMKENPSIFKDDIWNMINIVDRWLRTKNYKNYEKDEE